MTEIQNEFLPDYVSPPGDTLLEVLESLGMSQAELARRTGRPKKTINEIIQGKAAITPDTALQLELALGVPASFWNNREQQYQEALARIQESEQLEKQVSWLDSLPVVEMCRRGWMTPYDNPARQVREGLRYFGVASVEQWHVIWDDQLANVSFRQSAARPIEQGAVAAWLRKGELEAQIIECQPYNAQAFQKVLETIRGLTRQSIQDVLPEVVLQCASAGVAVVIVEDLPNTGVSGATRWVNPEKAILQLSLRYKCDDQFWFSFFHEAAHILRHGKSKLFLKPDKEYASVDLNREEEEANRFAADLLIPPAQFRKFVTQCKGQFFSKDKVLDFAEKLGIAPGIVVGRLQHDEYIPLKNLNGLRRTLIWDKTGQVVSVDREL